MHIKKLTKNLKGIMTVAGLAAICSLNIFAAEVVPANPRNVILFIGDGMDDHQVTIARNYLVGARGQLTLDSMPLRSASQVLTVDEEHPGKTLYVADSANSATAIATGVATSRGRIATTAKTDQKITTIVELAEKTGLRTGIISTAAITDATPASFIAHVNQRGCQGPAEMVNNVGFGGVVGDCSQHLKKNGGLGSIAEQLADSDVDVLLGGGLKIFQEIAEDATSKITVSQLAEKNGYQVITDKTELNDLSSEKKILGLFAEGTMPVKLIGENDRKAGKVTLTKEGDVEHPAPFSCVPNPAFDGMPSLPEMTEAALTHLSRDNSDGFFLMVESASIDKQSHLRRPCGHIGETLQLDEAVASALAFADQHPNTLVLVTADHGQAAQLIPEQSMLRAMNLPIYSPGNFARIKTPEGSILGVNYATNNSDIIEEHTGVQVPLYISGAKAGEIPGYLRQPEIFSIMARHLNLIDLPGS